MCPCKLDWDLKNISVQDLLIKRFEDEESAWEDFVTLVTFGNIDVYTHMEHSELLEFLEDDCDSEASDSSDDFSCSSDEEELIEDSVREGPSADDNYDAEDTDLKDLFVDLVSAEGLLEDIDGDLCEEDFCKPLQESLEESMQNLSLHVDEAEQDTSDCDTSDTILEQFGFHKNEIGPFLWRHPPAASGRDDKIEVIEQVLTEIITKLGLTGATYPKILFGPDQKIGINLLKLIKQKPKQFGLFLPEFPLLHLRKSKITILVSAYKDAGLRELLMYMKDQENDDLGRLLDMHCIGEATREIRRLSVAYHTAFIIQFMKSMKRADATTLLHELRTSPKLAANQWKTKYGHFLRNGRSLSATFALHHDMMVHCDEVVAIHLAERQGGEKGYKLLLAAVKSSLPFAFLNGATSYAPFCTQLILEYYRAGPFYMSMKHSLFTTPFHDSSVNFSGDTKREMDHQEALKGFRSGSTMNAVLWKMSLVDSTAETHQLLHGNTPKEHQDSSPAWVTTDVDRKHIFRVTTLILNRGGLDVKSDPVPKNVYRKDPLVLPMSILDQHCESVGAYLIQRYVNKNSLLPTSFPLPTEIDGPKELVDRAKKSKGTTIRRLTRKPQTLQKSKKAQLEEERQKVVKEKSKQADMMASRFNALQALLKPDGTKPKVQKSRTMKTALSKQLTECLQTKNESNAHIKDFMLLNATSYPLHIRQTAAIVTLEFAGLKFKLNPTSGDD
jgi:hypothetical protein